MKKEGANMAMVFDDRLAAQVQQSGVVAVLVVDRAEDAVPLAQALIEGGVNVMELTLRTDAALDALRAIRAAVPDMLAGIGTVLTPDQVKQCRDAGAAFAVSPGLNPRVVQTALDIGLSFAPGIATPSDVERALEFGCRLLKFFPAEAMGGLDYLKNMSAPYQHLGVKFVPLGGLNPANVGAYLSSPLVAAIGGSWLATRQLVADKAWTTVKANAHQAIGIRNSVRSAAKTKS
jgi:2-dehydro-3-deoxyphosphogluconate aldolase/(4S)-4-hydroxy-2-oxoglutarate aldolase